MKKYLVVLCLVCGFRAGAQEFEIEQLLLNFEKLTQFKQILSDMKAGYEIIVQGYGAIKNISEGNFNLHKLFLDKLMEVSPKVRDYYKVKEIIAWQLLIAKEYKTAWQSFNTSDLLNRSEKNNISGFYKNIFNESLQSLSDLTLVVTGGKLRMSDDERMMRIDRVHRHMREYLSSLRGFNGRVSDVLIERERMAAELDVMKAVQGIDK